MSRGENAQLSLIRSLFAFAWLFSQPTPPDYAVSRETWSERAALIRESILVGAHLDPPPERTPLNPLIVHRRFRPGFTVADVVFESAPGFYVFGNLYEPQSLTGRVPAILVPHGHFKSQTWFARTRPENQILCARLAQMGAVVFTYDMVGWGDSQQIEHNAPNVLQLQLWDSIRAVDFVSSLPNVDADRIGVTGASGGATQAIYLAAVDSRITASMPVSMVSSKYTGHERCEDGMPVHTTLKGDHITNVEIAAVIAPKPLMLISDGADWTKTFPTEDFPFIKRVYSLYSSTSRPGNVHFPRGRHDYGPAKRAVAYRFFADALGLKSRPAVTSPVRIAEDSPDVDANPEGVPIESQEDQTVRPWVELQNVTAKIPDDEILLLLQRRSGTDAEGMTASVTESAR